ncbi:MAG: hypothetical protein ACXU9L_00655 [Thermodesulfobacteriota bacterium]
MIYGRLILLVGLLIVMFSPQGLHAQGTPAFSNYDYYVTDDGGFGLYKPKGWKVGTQRYPNGKMLFVTDQKDLCYVSMLFLESIDPNHDSVTFAGSTLNNVSKQMPGIRILEARSSQDRMHTVVKYQRSGPKGTLIEGKYSFNVKRPTAVVIGYEAPAEQFKETLPTLLTTIANITLLDDQAYRTRASQAKGGEAVVPRMREVSAKDNTCRLLVPDGWNLVAAKGAAVCASPDENAGFIFTTVGFVARSRIPYFDSSKMPGLHYEYMRPIDALIVAARHMGSSNHKVLERHANRSAAMEGSAFLKKQVDAEIALISYTNKKGVPCIGYYDVVGSVPDNAGQWGIIPMGFWGPTNQFARYLPSLIKIAESFRINEQWASEYVRQGTAKVREMMKTTSSMMSRYAEEMRQSSLASHQNRMRSSDFISYKFSTYMRGEQEWVTGLEGGKIYKSDHYGISSGGQTIVEGPAFNYYNYHGERYGHIPVDSSREVYEAVKGIR